MNFTFKTERPTGRYRSFQTPTHTIKVRGIDVGHIGDAAPHQIMLRILKRDLDEDGSPNCPWRNIFLKRRSTSVDDAKAWLTASFDQLMARWPICDSDGKLVKLI